MKRFSIVFFIGALFCFISLQCLSQATNVLKIQADTPRFLKEGDRIELGVKIINLSQKELTGQAELRLLDATTNQPVDGWFQNLFPNQYFTVAAGTSDIIRFPIEVPFNFNKALVGRIIARAGNLIDSAEALLPILTNKKLLTEVLAIPLKASGTKSFSFENLAKTKNSETLKHHALTVEYSSDPSWIVMQALTYLVHYSYETSEQVWNRYFATGLAMKMIDKSPQIRETLKQWAKLDTSFIPSRPQKNDEFKSVLQEEAPWLLEEEQQQKQRIISIFDSSQINKRLQNGLIQLKQMQTKNGGFAWFKGGKDDHYMTQYIVTGIGRLKKLNVIPSNDQKELNNMLYSALSYLDKKFKEDYEYLLNHKADLIKQQISYHQIQYLYLRSFFQDLPVPQNVQAAYKYYYDQALKFWKQINRYGQAMIALTLNRTGDKKTASTILDSLRAKASNNEKMGMYWKNNSTDSNWLLHETPIEIQSLLIEAFNEVVQDKKTIEALTTWLIKNKETNNWQTTKATAAACYALLTSEINLYNGAESVSVKLGNETVLSKQPNDKTSNNYLKHTIDGSFITPSLDDISVTVRNTDQNKKLESASWVNFYWQYFEDIDNVTAVKLPVRLRKKLFAIDNSKKDSKLTLVQKGTELKLGDKVRVRIELNVDRNLEYIHLKDSWASALEASNFSNSFKQQGNLVYYVSIKHASAHFFFNQLPRGKYSFEFDLHTKQIGSFNNGVTTIEAMYAPEVSTYIKGLRLNVAP